MLAVPGNGRERRARRLTGDWPAPRQLTEENFDPQVGDIVKYLNAFMVNVANPLGTE